MRTGRVLALPLLLLAVAAAPKADAAAGSAGVAALQVGLRAHGFYGGAIDGITGPRTAHAVRLLQRRARIAASGFLLRIEVRLFAFGDHLPSFIVDDDGALGPIPFDAPGAAINAIV